MQCHTLRLLAEFMQLIGIACFVWAVLFIIFFFSYMFPLQARVLLGTLSFPYAPFTPQIRIAPAETGL